MNTKSVYQLDDEGFFVGETIAFESPLEPGIYHIPRGCVEERPPEVTFKERPRYVGSHWVKEVIYTQEQIRQIEEEIQKKAEEERLKIENEQKRLEEERLKQEELQRQEEEKVIAEEKLKQQLIEEQKRLKIIEEMNRLEKLIEENNKLNNLSQGQYEQILAQIAQLKN